MSEYKQEVTKSDRRQYTQGEIEHLKENYSKLTPEQLCNYFRRSFISIKRKANDLGLNRCNMYTQEEIEYLKENYVKLTHDQLCKYLKRSRASITNKARELNLIKDKSIYKGKFFKEGSKKDQIKVGDKFSNLEVIKSPDKSLGIPEGEKVTCKCLLCGTIKDINCYVLLRGATKTCGCNSYKQGVKTRIERFGTAKTFQRERVKTSLGAQKGCWFIIEEPKPKEKLKVRCTICNSTEKFISISNFLYNKNESCGCKNLKQSIKIGNKYGCWEVIEHSKTSARHITCKCMLCENQRDIDFLQLTKGKNKHCGCKKMKSQVKKDQTYGCWLALEDAKVNEAKIKCKCIICNQTVRDVYYRDLVVNETTSCGCSLELKSEKSKKTCLSAYGYERALLVPSIRNKITETLQRNGTVPTSAPQLKLFNLLKEAQYEVELNKPIANFNADIFVQINQDKIVIEYDGGGHFVYDSLKNIRKKDYARDKIMRNLGYKIFRIECIKKDIVPSLEQVKEYLQKLIESKVFVKLKLS